MAACIIKPPESSSDASGALRIFDEFFFQYQHVLLSADRYFDEIRQQIPPEYAEAYRPWQKGVRDLLQGVFLVARKVPISNAKAFSDALRLFSLESAIALLHDVCISCKLSITRDWAKIFKENIRALSEAFQVIYRQRVQAMGRA